MDNTKERRRCKECGSLQTYIKFSTNERVCRSCGHIQKLSRKSKDES